MAAAPAHKKFLCNDSGSFFISTWLCNFAAFAYNKATEAKQTELLSAVSLRPAGIPINSHSYHCTGDLSSLTNEV